MSKYSFVILLMALPLVASAEHIKEQSLSPIEQLASRYEPDMSLLQDWTQEGQDSKKCPRPLVGSFTGGVKSLRFIAVDHDEVGPEAPSVKLMKQTLNSKKPEILILEGFPSELGLSPESLKKYGTDCVARTPQNCTELEFAIAYAVEHQIPFQGGEPSDKKIHELLREKKYQDQDIAAFFWMRQIPLMQRSGKLNSANYSQQMQGFFSQERMRGLSINEADFNLWYKSQYNKDFKMEDIDPDDCCRPVHDSTSTLAQRIAYDIGVLRNENILRTTAQALRNYKDVAIQYGFSHYVEQRRVLSKMLPNFSCSR